MRSAAILPGVAVDLRFYHAIADILCFTVFQKGVIRIHVISVKLDIPDKDGEYVKQGKKGHHPGRVELSLPVSV